MFMKKGFSLPSIIIAGVISAILMTAAVSSMWGSVEHTKEKVLGSYLMEQINYLRVVDMGSSSIMEDLNNSGDANSADYRADLVSAREIQEIPWDLFEDSSALTWEIRRDASYSRSYRYYIYIDSTNTDDQGMIDRATGSLNAGSWIQP